MDIHGIRLENYRRLMDEFQSTAEQRDLPLHGLINRFAEKVGASAAYLSHINNRRKNIGSATARKLEIGMGRPNGWLDNDHSNDADTPALLAQQEFMAAALQAYLESPVDARAMLIRYMLERRDLKSSPLSRPAL